MKPPAPVTSTRSRCAIIVPLGREEGTWTRRTLERLARAVAAQYGWQGSGEDAQVQPERPIVDVLQVQTDPVVEPEIAAAADLPQAGQARRDAEAAHQGGLGEPIHVAERQGAG